MDNKKNWLPSGGRFLPNLMVVLIGIAFFQALSHLGPLRAHLNNFLSVINPFLVGIIIAYLLNAPTVYLERQVFAKFRRRRLLSILTSYLLAFAAIGILLTLILPQVIQSIMSLVNNLNGYLTNFNAFAQSLLDRFNLEGELLDNMVVSYQDIISTAADLIAAKLPKLLNYGVAIGNGLISGITALISSIYMLAGKEDLIAHMRKFLYALLPKKNADWLMRVSTQANDIFSGFIVGKILDSVIIGIMCFCLCLLLQIPLAILLGVIIGCTNVIPFFGPIVGAVPCLMILLIVDPKSALIFFILIIALQQFDGNILGPRILGNSTGLSAIWVLVAIVVGGGLFGFPGMLLGVPTFAVIYALTRDWANRRLQEKGIDGTGAPVPPKEEQAP